MSLRHLPWAMVAPAWVLCAATIAAQPLYRQIVVDPDHPQSFLRFGTDEHVWICGPGDPEDFLYRGTRQPDGTRAGGDQLAILDAMAAHGGNSLYVQTVRSFGGDGPADHNPFVAFDPDQGWIPEILDQWETWFTHADDLDILIYLFLYDDGAEPWSTGNQLLQPERDYVEAVVDRFEHHENLIFVVSEESEEAMSVFKSRKIAQAMADADDHEHLVGNHHYTGTTFLSWEEGSALTHFAMHYSTPIANVHARTVEGRANAEAAGSGGNAYQVLYAENDDLQGASTSVLRRFLWDVAMGGMMPMVTHMDVATTPVEQLEMCRIQQQFMEATDVFRMRNHDERASGATQFVLASENGRTSILYARDPAGPLGLAGVDPGTYSLLWLDCVTGAQVLDTGVPLAGGEVLFPRPAAIGPWHALWVRRTFGDLGPTTGVPKARPRLAGAWSGSLPMLELWDLPPGTEVLLEVEPGLPEDAPGGAGPSVFLPLGRPWSRTGPARVRLPSDLSASPGTLRCWVSTPGGWAATNALAF